MHSFVASAQLVFSHCLLSLVNADSALWLFFSHLKEQAKSRLLLYIAAGKLNEREVSGCGPGKNNIPETLREEEERGHFVLGCSSFMVLKAASLTLAI